jgi:hypothetical protein
MKTMAFSQTKQRASDGFSFILAFCPNKWPSILKGMNTAKAFEQLITYIDSIMEQIKNEESKQWLRICLQEIRQSWKNYDDGNLPEGKKLIQRAEEHFNNVFSKKPVEARFTAGESGAAADKKSGFPE